MECNVVNVLLSVIVPVYNVKDYLSICIESILNQTYENIELILIDDGSIDGSGEICDYYLQKDCRVKVVHKINGGVASARNAGLQIANGEYVAFVDSDDYCDNYMFEMLMATAYCMHADIVACGGEVLNEKNNVDVPAWIKRTLSTKFVVSNKFSSRTFAVRGLIPFLWNKVYKKSIIDLLGLKFNSELEIGEDTVFLKTLFPAVKTIIVIPDKLYHYRYNRDSSLSLQNQEEFILGKKHIKVINALATAWQGMDLLQKQHKHFMKWSLGYIFWQIEHLQSFELAYAFVAIWKENNLFEYESCLSKEEKKRLKKVKEYAEPDEKRRERFLDKRNKIAALKEKLRSHRLTYNLFDIYWNLRHRGKDATIKCVKSIIKEYKNAIIRDGLIFHFYALLRILRVPVAYEPYKEIVELKNIHEGESCFIVAPGPSLMIKDIEYIQDLESIAVNGTISLMNYSCWHPTYYVLFDGRSYKKILKEEGRFNIDIFPKEKAFLNALLRRDIEKNTNTEKIVFVPYCNSGNSEEKNVLHLRYNDNLLWGYYDLATVTNAAIHIAQYMGFKKIYLLGVDCDYSQPKQYFSNTKNNNVKSLQKAQFVQKRMFKAYSYMKKQMNKRGVEIYNATRGGALEVFPRIQLEDAVMQIKEEIKYKERNNE